MMQNNNTQSEQYEDRFASFVKTSLILYFMVLLL